MTNRPFDRTRRPTEWYSVDTVPFSMASGTQVGITLYSAVLQGARNILGSTITRTLLDFSLRGDSVAQEVAVFWGLLVMNADAVSASAFPEADDMSDRPDWLARGRMQTIQASLSDSSQWRRLMLDLRSQRVLRSEEDVYVLILDATTSGFQLNFSSFIRTLVTLP